MKRSFVPDTASRAIFFDNKPTRQASFRAFLLKVALSLASAFMLLQAAQAAAASDLDTGNAPVEVIIPAVVPVVFSDVSPTGSDVKLVIRVTTLVTNAWFDASAPYHPTALGVYSRLRRPASESATNRNIEDGTPIGITVGEQTVSRPSRRPCAQAGRKAVLQQ